MLQGHGHRGAGHTGWKLVPALQPGQSCAIYAERPAIMGQRMILVTPDREFDRGIVGPDERVVRELEGTKVVGATVVKEHQISHGWLVNVPSADAR
ncbi:hypothetical protein ABIB99_001255 [Bradyrhizobium sp. LA6.1]|uniref:hypothetical protein n=1 Tax=Bradyrhizobium sp. LA6.1 TaxID=3156378 RepID=UPI003398D2A9